MAITIKPPAPKASPYAAHMGSKPSADTAVVKSKVVDGTVQIGEAVTTVPVHKGVVDGGCKVGCSGGRTINLGNYESVKITVWLEMPCTKESMADTFDYVSEWVGQQLESAVKMAKG